MAFASLLSDFPYPKCPEKCPTIRRNVSMESPGMLDPFHAPGQLTERLARLVSGAAVVSATATP